MRDRILKHLVLSLPVIILLATVLAAFFVIQRTAHARPSSVSVISGLAP